MARILPRSLANVRQLLLALLAVGLVLRMGAGGEAMAAVPTAPAAHQSHCADMPAKPVKAAAADCALCVALPDTAVPEKQTSAFTQIEPTPATPVKLAGLAGGPSPPPPRIA